MLFHLPPKGGLVNPQGLGGKQTVPIVVPQRLEDDVRLEVVQSAWGGNRGGLIGGTCGVLPRFLFSRLGWRSWRCGSNITRQPAN